MNEKILQVEDLKIEFHTEEGVVYAVNGLSFDLRAGETLAIVGESGCGKSVTSLSLLNLIPEPPGKITGGSVYFQGKNLLRLREKEMRLIRGNDIAMIFQEPMVSLNPTFKIGRQVAESLIYHQNPVKSLPKKEAWRQAVALLRSVGIPSPETVAENYPHQLSGGMCQRVMIAMALACKPQILIADEPTTALDVTIQAQILRLLKDLNSQTNTAVILITHDLGIVAQTADRVMVMYAGQAVETGEVKRIFKNPRHPYTIGLLNSIPKLHEEQETLYSIKGMVPGMHELPSGCSFAPRCDCARDRCRKEVPALIKTADGYFVRCFRAGEDLVHER